MLSLCPRSATTVQTKARHRGQPWPLFVSSAGGRVGGVQQTHRAGPSSPSSVSGHFRRFRNIGHSPFSPLSSHWPLISFLSLCVCLFRVSYVNGVFQHMVFRLVYFQGSFTL